MYKSLVKRIRQTSVMERILICVFLFQFFTIMWINFTQLKYHLGYDASKNYLASAHMVQVGNIIMNDWNSTTGYPLVGVTPLAALFYSLIHNIFLAWGFAINTMVVLMVLLLYLVLKKLNYQGIGRWIPMNLFLIPYIGQEFNNVNDLGYFSCVLTGVSYYSVLVLLTLANFYVLISDDIKLKKRVLFAMSVCVFSLLFALASGLNLWMLVLVPCLAFYVLRALLKNDFRYLISFECLFLLVEIIGSLFAKMLAKYIPILSRIDITETFNYAKINDFRTCLLDEITGFSLLLNIFPRDLNISATSQYVFPYLCALFVMVFLLVGWILELKEIIKGNIDNTSMFAIVIIVNIIFFAIVPMRYGSDYMEYRYWIPGYMGLVCLLGKALQKFNHCFKYTIVLGFMIVIMGLDISGDYYYVMTRIDAEENERLAEITTSYDVPLVYTYSDDAYTDNIRIFDLDKYYAMLDSDFQSRVKWGNYTDYYDAGEYDGPNCLIIKKGMFSDVPLYYARNYLKIDETNEYEVYYSEKNVFDFTSEMTDEKLQIDYPYTSGYLIDNGMIESESGELVTNGTEGFALYGPNVATVEGTYDYNIYYEVVEEGVEDSYFDIALDNGTTVLSRVNLEKGKNMASVKEVKVENGHTLEQRVYNGKGATVKFKRIERIRH